MGQDQLTKAVVRRLKELGLPPALMELGEFRDHFFFHRCVMFVRDGDKVVDVHLIQPQQKSTREARMSESVNSKTGARRRISGPR